MSEWKQAIVRVWHGIPHEGGKYQGTAFLISPCHLITARHVLNDISCDELFLQGQAWSGLQAVSKVSYHDSLDVAVLTLKKAADGVSCIPLTVSEQAEIQQGQRVTLAGYSTPHAELETPELQISAYDGVYDLLVTQSSIAPGMSGGAVLFRGRLAGIVLARHHEENKSYLLRLNAFREFVAPYADYSDSSGQVNTDATLDGTIRVFISYAREDYETARRLYDDLKLAGITPWMDKADLLPGQKWEFHIKKAIRESSYFIALLSSNALSKRGVVHKELKLAVDIFDEFPDEDIFLIPARLDECEPADERLKYLHWADLFPSYEAGRDEILRVFQVAESGKADDKASDVIIQSVSEPEREFINSLNMKFVYIKPGTFMIGSPENEKGRSYNEILHKVTLTRGFYIQTTQVTVGNWRTFVRDTGFKTEAETGDGAYGYPEWKKHKEYYWDNPGFGQTDSHPVTCVSWNDVQAFIKWLNQKEGKTYRLSTEAEWEYACRAGSETAYCFGDDVGRLGEYAWYEANSAQETHPVVQKYPNDRGLYDMHGNVCEWCQDWYNNYLEEPVTDPIGSDTVSDTGFKPINRIFRGGAWGYDARNCRSASRDCDRPNYRFNYVGFRLLRETP